MSDPDATLPVPKPLLDGAASSSPDISGTELTDSGILEMLASVAPGSTRSDPHGWLPPTPEKLQDQMPQYKVLDLIGRGGMGAVYRGWQVSLERYVAIKILPPDIDDGDAHFAARFKQEAKTMAKFQHPCIVSVHDAGETTTGLLYIVMEFVEGTDVAQMVKSQVRLRPELALAITAHVCDALQYAHTRKVIHRDIKPANVMMDTEGQVKVADFGLAKATGSARHGLTSTNMSVGTPDYIAPEALMLGVIADHRADLYAVGVMLYNMLTGEIPRGHFRAASEKAGTDLRFDAIILKAMEQEREHRYQSALEMHRDLDVILNAPIAQAVEAPPPVRQQTIPPARKPVMKGPERKDAAFGTPRQNANVALPKPPPKKSSNILLIGGIMATFAVGAVFIFGGKKEPAKGSAGSAEKLAPVASPSTSSIPPVTATYPQPPKWTDATATFRSENLGNGDLVAEGDWLKAATKDMVLTTAGGQSFRNPILRVLFSGRVGLRVRRVGKAGQDLGYNGYISQTSVGISLVGPQQKTMLTDRKLDSPDGEHEGVFAAQGDALTLWLDGKVVASAHDSTLAAGSLAVGIYKGSPQGEVRIKKVEYGELPDTTPAETAILPAARLSPSTEPWQDVLHDPAQIVLSGAAERTPEGLRFTDAGRAKLGQSQRPKHDGAVRMMTTFGGMRPELMASAKNWAYRMLPAIDGKTVVLTRYETDSKKAITLGEFHLRAPLQPGQDYESELRIVGQTLIAKLNGEIIGKATDEISEHLGFGVGVVDHRGTPTLIKALEVLDLDATAQAPPAGPKPSAARLSPSTEPWQDVLRDPAQLDLTGGAERTPAGLRLTDHGGAYRRPSPKRDGAVRLTMTFAGNHARLQARQTDSGEAYQLNSLDDGKTIALWHWYFGIHPATVLRTFPLREPLKPGQDYELELRVMGQTLTAKLNGEVLGLVTDGTLPEGRFGVVGDEGIVTPVLVKSVEVLDLDVPGGAGATPRSGETPVAVSNAGPAPKAPSPAAGVSPLPANATNETPFVNSLGMKFVPVPITGGPSGGRRVLFSIWDTRVRDYEVFVKETKSEWPKPDFKQPPNDPAVNVSWEDARAFCTWLTERERKSGRLGAKDMYHLPGDHEWSCAVGIGEREDAGKLPTEKNSKILDAFPWGSTWPPPKRAGNYAGEELQPALAAGKFSYSAKGVLSGYRDDFVNTSAVGSFARNRFGLYDMSGNVWQWCEDCFDKDQKDRVLRGGAWYETNRTLLLSSYRNHYTPDRRNDGFGFRCVLADDSASMGKSPGVAPAASKTP